MDILLRSGLVLAVVLDKKIRSGGVESGRGCSEEGLDGESNDSMK